MSRSPAPGACCSAGITGCWSPRSCGGRWSLPPGNFPGQTGHREGRVPDMPDAAVCAGDPQARDQRIQLYLAVTPAGTMNSCGSKNDSAHRGRVPSQAHSVISPNNYRSPNICGYRGRSRRHGPCARSSRSAPTGVAPSRASRPCRTAVPAFLGQRLACLLITPDGPCGSPAQTAASGMSGTRPSRCPV